MYDASNPVPDLSALPMARSIAALSLTALALFVGQVVVSPGVVAVLFGAAVAVTAGVLTTVALREVARAAMRTDATDRGGNQGTTGEGSERPLARSD